MTIQNESNPASPERGTTEYNEMMAARFEQGFADQVPGQSKQSGEQENQTPQRPENVPEKFWDPETGQVRTDALLASYMELEKTRGTEAEQPEGETDGGEGGTDESTEGEADEGAKKAVEEAGLNWEEVTQYAEQNDYSLSDDHYKALEKIGVPRDLVDTHMELLSMSKEFATMRTAEYVGGKENLDMIMERAGKELKPEEVERYNQMLATPDWQVAMDALKARFLPEATSFTNKGDLFSNFGQSAPGTGTETAFKSKIEMTSAINKRDEHGRRLYDIDPAYRTSVQRRIALMG